MIVKLSLTWMLAVASAVSGFTIEDAGSSNGGYKSSAVPGRFIIEYEGGSRFVKRDSDAVQSGLSDFGVDASVNNQYDFDIFQGASIHVSNTDDVTAEYLKSIDGVKNAWQASYITLDDEYKVANTSVWDPHVITGVDILHERGIYGEGVTIAVIDTGIDYTHPALGGGIGENYPILGGYDFTEDPENPTDDPMDCAGHGTFVSSVIIGNSDKMFGVAPEAKIKMYKVFNCKASTSDDILMAGLLKAYEDKPNIISLSLGADRGYNSIPIAVVSSRIAQDITIMYAAGNSGELGSFMASDGGAGKHVLSIGSTHATQMLGYKAVAVSTGGDTKEFGYLGNSGNVFTDEGTFKVLVSTESGCNSSQSADNNHNLFIVRRGVCETNDLYESVEENGWKTVLVYPNSEEEYLAYLTHKLSSGDTLNNFGSVSWEFAQWALAEAEVGNSIEITIRNDYGIYVFENANINSGQMDYFSSWGPTFENNFYPSVSAPGGSVFGAAIGGEYHVGSGTSYACPYVAGVAALYFSARPSATPEEFRRTIMSTAVDLVLFKNKITDESVDISTIDYSKIAPAIQQGAGLIDTVKMLDQRTKIISQPYLELNDTVNRVEDFEITIRNDNFESISYALSHVAATSIDTRNASMEIYEYFPPTNDNEAEVTFAQTSFTLGVGESITVNVNIKLPDTDARFGTVFSGKVVISGGNGDSVVVPYMGVQVDTYEWSCLYNTPLVVGYDGKTNSYFNLSTNTHEFSLSYNDTPRIMFNFVYGSIYQSFDIVDEDYDLSSYSYPLVAGENGFFGSLKSQDDQNGTFSSWPATFIGRFNKPVETGVRSYSNDTSIEPGRYRILSRALRMFGDLSNHDDWILILSDPFSVAEVNNSSSGSSTATSSISSSTSEPSSSSSIGPSITGTIVDGNPQWELSLPGELGPWSSVDFSASAEGGFTFNDIKYVIDGKSYAVNSTMVRDVDFNTQLYSEDGLTAHFGGRYISGDSFTINITIAITRPDQPESLSKRDVLVFELSNTLILSSSSSCSINSDANTSTTTKKETDTTVITITPCIDNKCSETTATTGLTVVTSTIHGVVTENMTFCPLSTSIADSATGLDSAALSFISRATDDIPETSITVSKIGTQTAEVTLTPTTVAVTTSTASISTPVASTFEGAAVSNSAQAFVAIVLPFLFLF